MGATKTGEGSPTGAGADNAPACQLYLITPPRVDDRLRFLADIEAALDAGPVACLQLRLKDISDDVLLDIGAAVRDLCHDRDVAYLVNDRADIAVQLDADGVHLGQGDGDIAEARTLLGFDRSIGVTCHNSMDLAFAAGEAGADYVAFGSFFPTTTKTVEHFAEPDLLVQWSDIAEIPSVAIGGITPDRAVLLSAAGADFIAVSGYVWSHPDGPAAAVSALVEALPR